MNPILWTDLECTGTNPEKHSIVQIAAAIEIKGEIVDTFNRKVQPLIGYEIEDEALKVMGRTKADLMTGDDPMDVYRDFYRFLAKYGHPKQKDKRYIPAGYNTTFDLDFLLEYFTLMADKFAFWDMLEYRPIDPYPTIVSLWRLGKLPGLENCQLPTVIKYFGIDGHQAHDALSDLMATRRLSQEIFSTFIGFERKSK